MTKLVSNDETMRMLMDGAVEVSDYKHCTHWSSYKQDGQEFNVYVREGRNDKVSREEIFRYIR